MTNMHMMIDGETFATSPDAALIQLGAAAFRLDETGVPEERRFHANVTLQSAVLVGARIDFTKKGTVDWWKDQSTEARASVCGPAVSLQTALEELSLFFHRHGCAEVWSHGACFDIPIVDWSYRACGMTAPWRYTKARDTRTLFWIATALAGWEKPERVVDHVAVLDAVAQAEDVQEAIRALRDKADAPWERLLA